jgi:hypothetical protein
VRQHGLVPAGELRLRGFDQEVLVGGVSAAAVSQPEVAGGEFERLEV